MNKIIQTIVKTLSISALLLSSCIKEDMSNCPEQIRVYFDIETRTSEGDAINPDDVDRMNLYVFSHKGYYLGEYRDEYIPDFGPEYYIDCSDLLPGKYSFIAWGGKDERCYSATPAPFVKGETTFGEALLMLEHPNETVSGNIHHLFHSDLAATVTNQKVQRFDMPLIQQTNTINIHTVGLPADDDVYIFNIADNNCTYQFDRSFATFGEKSGHGYFKYVAPCAKDETSQLHSTLNVMRLSAERHTPQLQIFNETAGTVLYPTGIQSGDLIGLIQSADPDNDFDLIHTYDIVLEFKKGSGEANLTVTIFVNGWEIRDQNSELIVN